MKSFLTLLFLFGTYLSFSQANVTAMRYYLDTDPGVGNGTLIGTFTPGTTFDESFTIDQSSLSEGFHTLVIRVLDENSVWGMQESKTFYVSPSDPVVTADVVAGEYFLDIDPGVTGGTSFDVSSGMAIDDAFTILSTGGDLTEGFHNLVIRLQDSDGQWSMQESKAFYITSSDPVSTADVVAAEYYLDTDPGVGAATDITPFTSGTSVNFDFTILSVDLTEGFHNLVIRTQDSGGQWSVQESKAIYVSSSDPIVTDDVVAAEYYLDTDPGIGEAVDIAPFTSGATVDFNFTILSTDLSEGFHNLVIRTQDTNGQWGVQESRAFYVSNTNPLGTTLVSEIEYFIDVDPGQGDGTSLDVVDAVSFDENLVAVTNGLAAGMHTIGLRALDERGNWSLLETRNFLVDEFVSGPLDAGITANIASYEYYIDVDPGYGAATEIDIDPDAFLIDEDFSAMTNALAQGVHTLGVRVTNEFGLISQSEIVEFTMCDGATVSFDVSAACLGEMTMFTDNSTGVIAGDIYSWDFDGDDVEDDNTVGDASFTYLTSGTYTASLTISNADCTATGTVEITVTDLPTVIAEADNLNLCLGDEVTLSGSGADSYTWDNGVTDGIAFSPTATTTYTVTGTDANDCVNTDMVTIEVIEVPAPTISIESDNGRQIVLSSSSETGNQWFESGNELTGETNQTLSVERTYFFGGSFTVEVTQGACFSSSTETALLVLSSPQDMSNVISIWPNPAKERLSIEFTQGIDENHNVRILDLTGSVVSQETLSQGVQKHEFNISKLQNGIYLLQIEGQSGHFKFLKE